MLKNILIPILTIALLYFFISDDVRTDEIKKIERIENSIVDSYDRLNDVVEVPSITKSKRDILSVIRRGLGRNIKI